jgi:hypothetical protein
MLQSKKMFGRGLGKRLKRSLESTLLLVRFSLNMFNVIEVSLVQKE